MSDAVPIATGGDEATEDRTVRRGPSPLLVAVLGFLAVSVVLLLLGRLALDAQVATARQDFEPGVGWFGQWVRWDGNWYYRIAHDGYDWGDGVYRAIAFWPTYPMAIRGLSVLTNDGYDAGLIITWCSGFAAVVLFARWCQDRMTRAASIAAVVTLLLLPYAWYLHWAVYGDALFAATALGAFLLLERDRPLLAGLVGAVASAGRPMGMAVAFGLTLLSLERRDVLVAMEPRPGGDPTWRRLLTWLRVPRALALRRLRLRDLGVLLAFSGPLLYMWFLWHSEGDPLAFIEAERAPGWGHDPGPRTWLKLSFLGALRGDLFARETLGMILHGTIAVGAVLLIPKVIRRFGWGYGVFCLILVGIPVLSSKDFYGLGRYLLAAFPVVAVAGEWLVDRPVWARAAVWSVSGTLLAFISYSYARGLYVA